LEYRILTRIEHHHAKLLPLLQIALAINQLVERSADMVELLNEHSKQTKKTLWKELIMYLKSIPYSEEQVLQFFSD
jgi:hypothetical protein